ncbi:alpha/beta-hydrolase [Atractiella rhizophila]|nr:alpha/beta-hydrolase [Atractiella rhizophila]
MDQHSTSSFLRRSSRPPAAEYPQAYPFKRALASASKKKRAGKRAPADLPPSSSFYVSSLPGLPASSTLSMFAGHLSSAATSPTSASTTPGDPNLFFLLMKNRHIADRPRLIIWFNGGPGCSSFDGAMMEIGPWRLKGGELREVEGGWNEYANVLFVDQPAGTGYSTVNTDGYVHELGEVGSQMVSFLRRFYDVFPEYEYMETYLAGESYAGQYIPYIASSILSTTLVNPPLKGLLIGNGWIDPISQYPAYLDMALESSLIKRGTQAFKDVEGATKRCNATLEAMERSEGGVKVHVGACERILSLITDKTLLTVNGQQVCVNNYDVRLTDSYPSCGMNWPPDLTEVTPYLSREDVKQAFHAQKKQGNWHECAGDVGANFWASESKPAVELLPALLEKVEVLLFAGDQDLICNHRGIEALIDRLTWQGVKGWGDAVAEDWFVSSVKSGTWTRSRNLTYALVHGASHMVPYDVPLVAQDMVLRFMGVDLLAASGEGGRVPSRVGDEEVEAVVGQTSSNVGTTKEEDEGGMGVKEEEYANVGSAAFIILLLGAGVAIFWFFRRKSRGGSGSGGRKGKIAVGGGGREERDRMRSAEEGREHELQMLMSEGEVFAVGDEEEDGEREDKRREGKD